MELAADEMLTHIIQYAYPAGGEAITVSCSIDPLDRLSVEIVDEGLRRGGDSGPSSRDRGAGIGGLGILLARKEVDPMTYQREGSRNILTMFKKRSQRP